MNVTDYTNIKTLLVKFKEKSDVLYAKASALSDYATIEWVGTQIPSVGNGTVTIKQNGTSKGSFTMNQSGGATINLIDTTYSSLSAVSGGTDKSLVTTGEKYAWNSKQAAISDLATIRSNATTAFGWGDHSKAGYITGITKAMVEGVLTGNIMSHTHTFASLTSKPTTLSGYGITDASRIFRYTIPASGNKGVRITFTSGEPVKITVSGANGGAQLVLVGTGYGAGGFLRNNFTELVQSTSYYTWCLADEACSVEVFSVRTTPDMVTVESPSPVTFTAISALSTNVAYRHLLTSENYSKWALPLTGGNVTGSIRMDGDTIRPLLIYNYSSRYGGGWARSVLECRVDDKNAFAIMPFGNYTSGATNNKIQYVSLGFAGYDGLNLRISDTSLTWGNDAIYHAGNCNNYTTNWKSNVMVSMGISSPYSDVFDANNPDRWINSNYGSVGKDYSNMPDGWEFGTVLTIGQQNYRGINGNLNAQFVWDVQHSEDANNPGRLWWRTKNERTGWKNWQELLHTGNFIDGTDYISPKTTLKGYGIEDWVLEHTANSPDTFQTAGVYRVSDVGTTGDGYDFRYGQVLVLRGGTSSDTIAQIAAPYFGSDLYFRSGTISNFTDAAHPWWTIYTSGNCNLPTIPWECSSLTANGSVEAKASLYGQRLEFSNIGSSAGNGGYIDFHYNGNTADYTSRIIEDAAGQLTLSAGIVNIGTSAKGFLYLQRPSSNYIWANKAGGEICIGTADGGETSALNSGINIIGKSVYIGGTNSGSDALNVAGDVKASGWCKATNGLLIEESGVYYTHHSQFGEIDIANGNEFIWGSKTDTLYFNYRASANGTTTVARYIWNAGSPTTYATHTMGTLTVLGAITATTTIHATTGIHTDGYISAKQASASSDRRLKKDFCKIDNALKYVLNTHYTRFRWKDDDKESIGIIAQEEQNREYGFLVQNNEKIGHLTYDYAASTALLGAAIQEEDSKVEKLRKRIIKLENELSNLKKKWQH